MVLVILLLAFYHPWRPTENLVPKPGESETKEAEEMVVEETEEVNTEVQAENMMESLSVVERVVDGDTIELENGEKVRYIGIDTPETKHPNKAIQCFGVEAAVQNKELVEGKAVRLEKDVTDRDRYGRLLRYVYVGEKFINYELVRQGFALVYTYPPDVKYNEVFLEAQKQAREEKLGLWNMCK